MDKKTSESHEEAPRSDSPSVTEWSLGSVDVPKAVSSPAAELSLRERVLAKKKHKTFIHIAAAVIVLLIVVFVAASFLLAPQTTTTTTTTTTTSTTTTTTSTTTTLPFPRTGEVKIAAYQFKTPYIPENNYLDEEWIVLKNKDTVAVNMSGWVIKNFNYKNTYTLPIFVLAPEASVKIHTGSGLDTETDLYMGKKDEFWNNNVDDINVFDADWNLVDSYYGLARNQHPSVD